MKSFFLLPLAATLIALAAPASAAQHQCVQLNLIDQTPAIDDKTVLIKLRGKNHYMRMDLLQRCPGIDFSGFMHESRLNELCTSDPLKVIEPVGAVCMIDKIVDITPEEARSLMQRKK